MRYHDFLIRRVLYTIPALVGLSILIFIIARVLPGDPARLALGPEAGKEAVQQLRREMGLDRPLHEQYVRYVQGLAHGRFGRSLYTHRDVGRDLADFFPATFELTTAAMLISIVAGVSLGMITAVKQDKWEDHGGRIVALSGVSMPRFWIGILFQLVFAFHLDLLPITGRLSPSVQPPSHITGLLLVDSLLAFNGPAFKDALAHIIMPAVVLALSPTAQIMRLVRASAIEQLRKPYILAARANGMPEMLLIYKYVLKNAFISALTIIGLLYGFFLGGAFVVEFVFSWPGMARYGVQALLFKDFNAIVGVTLVVGTAYAVINVIVDVLYGYVDPRIRLGHERSA
ncbi:MAG: ABC transporter permease [Anaerolineae bacterium]